MNQKQYTIKSREYVQLTLTERKEIERSLKKGLSIGKQYKICKL
jgi:hypothetical protein